MARYYFLDLLLLLSILFCLTLILSSSSLGMVASFCLLTFSLAGIMFCIQSIFIGLAMIIIYVGAIAILFSFSILLIS